MRIAMLQDKDRIFTNIYGMHERTLAGAKARGHWDGTAGILDQVWAATEDHRHR
jgi:NADH-quinone oxidoreductase subunit F